MDAPQNLILHVPIEQLQFSRGFKILTKTLGFYTIDDLLQYHTRELMIMPGFKVGLLHEYITFMEERDLGHLVDPVKKKQ